MHYALNLYSVGILPGFVALLAESDPLLEVTTKGGYDTQLLLIFLLAVGLFFFIRASVKDRTEQHTLISTNKPEVLARQITTYMKSRAYRLVNADDGILTYQGVVAQSEFLAVLLSVLALTGLGSFALVLNILIPVPGNLWFAMTLLSPIAGKFYWERASRPEEVKIRLVPPPETGPGAKTISRVLLKGHKEELKQFQLDLGYERIEEDDKEGLICMGCKGTGLEPCSECQGSGYVMTQGLMRRCPKCESKRTQFCTQCPEGERERAEAEASAATS